MEKILFISNAHLSNSHAIDFACYLARHTQSKLTGIFLEEEQMGSLPPKQLKDYSTKVTEGQERNGIVMDIDQTMEYFVKECQTQRLRSDVHPPLSNPVDEIVHESLFNDLMIIASEMLTSPLYYEVPIPFVKQVLLKTECPVIIAPAVFNDIDNIVFCYDGSPSAIFAIKQFTYLFPIYADKKITVLNGNDEKKSSMDKHEIRKLLTCYYYHIIFEDLEGSVDSELFKYFLMKENTPVIMGAYGRHILSTFFRPSSADMLLKTVDLPVFIAHL